VFGAKLAGRLAEFRIRLQSMIETVHVASRCSADSGWLGQSTQAAL
jgi:hypothetical protein